MLSAVRQLTVRAPALRNTAVRCMGGHGSPPVEAHQQAVLKVNGKEVIVATPEIEDSLEWVLESPPPLHQFEEPPIFIETDGCMSSDKVEFVKENVVGEGAQFST